MPGYPAMPPGQQPYGAPGFAPQPGGPYPGAPAPAAAGGGGSMKMIIIIIAAVVVLGLGGFLLYYFVLSGDDSSGGGKSASGCDAACSAYVKCEADKAKKEGEKVTDADIAEEKADCMKFCAELKPATQAEAKKCSTLACDAIENCLEGLEEFDKTAPAAPTKAAAAAGGGGGGGGGGSVTDCASYVERTIQCGKEMAAMAGGAAPAVDMEAQREGLVQACQAAPAMTVEPAKACNGKTDCMEWMGCIAEQAMKAMEAASP
jgi:hypothetical protein